MNIKRLAVIFIAVIFVVVTAFSSVAIFTVKQIDLSYSVLEGEVSNPSAVKKQLDSNYVGKNLLFLDEEDVVESLKDDYYLEVLSVDKQYPNVLKVSVKERLAVYAVNYGGEYYYATKDGFVVEKVSSFTQTRDIIELDLSGFATANVTVGQNITTDDDELLLSLFEMAKAINLTDCVKSISVENVTEFTVVSFKTYTGVEIKIDVTPDYNTANGQPVVLEPSKASIAFYAYDTLLTDYQKSYGVLDLLRMKDGRYRVTYNNQEIYTAE